jgi:hypothetical protein
LPHKAFAHKADKTSGCNLFAGLPCRQQTLHAKICYALCPLHWPSVLSAFARSLSAAILDSRPKHKSHFNPKSKAGKGRTENRAGSMACRAEGFFCLDLLVTFGSSQK